MIARFRPTAILVTLLLVTTHLLPAAAKVEGYNRVRNSLALIGHPTGDSRLPIGFGTGFAVAVDSDKRRSYLVTNNHVVADLQSGTPFSGLFAILPRDPTVRRPATIVRRNADLDIAIVSIDVGDLQTVSVSQMIPAPGDDVAIAGFPYSEVCGMAALCSPSRAFANGHKGHLIPVLKSGAVNQSQEGAYSIMYDAEAAPGNSGGPLFDAHTGDVYGIVVDALPGYNDPSLPPQIEANRAIAIGVGLPFINKSPVIVAAVGSRVAADRGIIEQAAPQMGQKPGGSRAGAAGGGFSSAPPRVCPSRQHFDQAFGEWLQADGLLKSIAKYAIASADASHVLALQPAVTRIRSRESKVIGTMQAALANLRGQGATTTARLGGDLVAAVRISTGADGAVAESLTSAAALANAKRSAAPLHAAAAKLSGFEGFCGTVRS